MSPLLRLSSALIVALCTGCAQTLTGTTPSPEVAVGDGNAQIRVHATGAAGEQQLDGAFRTAVSGGSEVQGQLGGCIITFLNPHAIPDRIAFRAGRGPDCMVERRDGDSEDVGK